MTAHARPPYTDADLRAEAARQHAELAKDPYFMEVGEMMQSAPVAHTVDTSTPVSWRDLLRGTGGDRQYSEAQGCIHDLICTAADTSAWAIALGIDGLEPEEHTLTVGYDPGNGVDTPRVRLHFAFHPDLDHDARTRFVMELSRRVLANL
ncbi:hypothetical protein [Streptomyces jumonjinensis]|uniref:Uncharacterized protein n=1 Tax=Streptomyces jumonjinensis TaxID=1945 RepID=A0A646KNR4_STRJU|nr:hypothetical protein [Streptomyces jumonjinensis]MQT03885.1 hypothetical protein [Streptomyces jumonjinensis]